MGQWITLTGADGTPLPAWQAEPAGAARGALVLLQEIFGVNAHIRDVADRLAAQGYRVCAPALFTRVQADVELGYGADDMAQARALKAAAEAPALAPQVRADVQTAIDHLAQTGAGKVGIVGFCWGGLLAWRAACELHGLAAAVCYYGGGMTAAPEASRQPRVPVLAHFGARDHWISTDSVHAFAQAQPGAEVHLYAADHGFHCDQRDSYDAAAAALAGARTLAFLARHL